jgi:hypothetical protein
VKLKYSASLAIALWLCVVAWVGAMIASKPRVGAGYDDGDSSASIAQLQQDLRRNQVALAALDTLAGNRGTGLSGPLVAPAPQPPPGADGSVIGDPNLVAPAPHRLSMILWTDGHRRAVIDGETVRVGTRLADGSRVRAIGRDRVQLENQAGERVVARLPAPYSTPAPTEAGP